MKRDMIPIFDAALKANRIGGFTKGDEKFDIIRPGYDSQGRRRTTWTQITHDGIPVYTVKMDVDLNAVLKKFNDLWEKSIAPAPEVLKKALKNAKAEARSKFRDGKSGEAPAPALTVDGRGPGVQNPA